MILASFILFLALFAGIGALAARRRVDTAADYLIASRQITPGQVALSAIATNSSGFMFIGQIGFAYEYGLQALALTLGWKLGDVAGTALVHRRARLEMERLGALSFSELLARWGGGLYPQVRAVSAILILAFLGAYAAAQISAGGKALQALLGWSVEAGAAAGGALVLLYCWAGGIRASVWTDVAQGLVMAAAMAVMLCVTVLELGGLGPALETVAAIGPDYVRLLPAEHALGVPIGGALFLLGWFCGGVGAVGQPHVAIRFLMLDDPARMLRARLYYYGWSLLYSALTLGRPSRRGRSRPRSARSIPSLRCRCWRSVYCQTFWSVWCSPESSRPRCRRPTARSSPAPARSPMISVFAGAAARRTRRRRRCWSRRRRSRSRSSPRRASFS